MSPGCEHCYAETLSKRVGHSDSGTKLPLWGVDATRKPASEKLWKELTKWNAVARRDGVKRRVFVASMADVFEVAPERNANANDVMRAGRKRLWEAIEECTNLVFQLLTKRPENVAQLAPWGNDWPTNVWLGTTVEDQKRADERIPRLLSVPAKTRFLSCEPLLEEVDLGRYVFDREAAIRRAMHGPMALNWDQADSVIADPVDWVILGGESGPGCRVFKDEWAWRLLGTCHRAGIPFFMKQLGGAYVNEKYGVAGALLKLGPDTPKIRRLKDGMGGDESEWPIPGLAVRQFPNP